MKKLFHLAVALVFTSGALLPHQAGAQPPEKMSYQAVIRDAGNDLVTNHTVGMQISILRGSASGIPVYTEVQTPTTNANGLASIEIGGETGFDTINWSKGPYFIKTETDPTGGTNYSITGTSQLLSVPYALFAKTAENINGIIPCNETDPVFNASIAKGITAGDTARWNNKPDSCNEKQSLADVIAVNNSANDRIKNVSDPVDAQDAATKSYVDALREKLLELQAEVGVTDIEDNHYKAVKIGNQIWMAENLKVTKYNNGEAIISYAYSWYDDDEAAYKNIYGALYQRNVVNTDSLCPVGWHLPSDADWTILFGYLGGDTIAGGKLKETGTTHWVSPNNGATDETGFTALPGGFMVLMSHGLTEYFEIGKIGKWLSVGNGNCVVLNYLSSNAEIRNAQNDGTLSVSVRCLKD